ncbi:MAG: bifunctional oligoribonuclease/PAP phosphatase NrnA [Clostridia bacterium]|nr:bifunctional oligoribonuclease/PAP phosphatase NrnA [Clostridia bacterium]
MILEEIKNAIDKAMSIAIICHTRPDADAIGASLGLCSALKKYGKRADVFCDEENIPERLLFLEGGRLIGNELVDDYELWIAIDCGDVYRLGKFWDRFSAHKNTVCVDHHVITNDRYARINYVEDFSSASEMAFEIIKYMNIQPDVDIATDLMAGIITDTNRFGNSNTTSRSFLAAGELMQYGVDINELSFKIIRELSYPRIRLIGVAMERIKLYFGGRVALTYVFLSDYDKYGATSADSEGLADRTLNVEGAEMAVSISQSEANVYKISMRGRRNANVCDVCRVFGGGGHRVAAGCTIKGDYYDVLDKLLKAIGDELNVPFRS